MSTDPIGATSTQGSGPVTGAGYTPDASTNPENVMFSAMMARSQELANLMNSYYEGIQTENQQMAQYNDLMSQLDDAEAAAGAGGPNGTANLSQQEVNELEQMGISVPSGGQKLNSTQISDLNDSVKNQVTNLSTQSETDMDQLQELSNNYNTVAQEISSFVASITQTNQQISSNLK